MLFDIHSHILPAVDDGAKNTNESVEILKMMKESGITAVVATPHFYPMQTDFEEFFEITQNAYNELCATVKSEELPEIYLGCEMLYYKGIGNSDVINRACLNRSKYLLLELAMGDIHQTLFDDILLLKEQNIIPIIAHIERYAFDRRFKKLLKFVRENDIPVQINAVSFLIRRSKKLIKEIFKSGIFVCIGTDAHSTDERPPLMKEALEAVSNNFGTEQYARLIDNSTRLYNEIIGENSGK